VLNILTFDVEEWDETFNLNKDKNNPLHGQTRVAIGVKKILRLLKDKKVKATFFVLGKVAEINADMVRMIDEEGHEIATHGYGHMPIALLTPVEFKEDLLRSVKILKDITGKEVLGYRAPGYSITTETRWAIEIIKGCGLQYDSSIYPVSLRLFTRGGISGYPQKPFVIQTGLVEFPLATISVFGLKLPIATTTYFRLFPYFVTKWAINMLNKGRMTANINLHSWEFDPEQPKVKLPFPQNIKHYCNLSQTEGRLKRLIGDFKFISCKEALLQRDAFNLG